MKHRPVASLVALLLWSGTALASERYLLGVDGLAYPFCAYGVEKQLSRIDGVEAVETDVKAAWVVVVVRDGIPFEESNARTAVEAAGFTSRSFSRAPEEK